ncbi:unnamed protein product, partial [Ectocarpus sp. 8 AP-2014]
SNNDYNADADDDVDVDISPPDENTLAGPPPIPRGLVAEVGTPPRRPSPPALFSQPEEFPPRAAAVAGETAAAAAATTSVNLSNGSYARDLNKMPPSVSQVSPLSPSNTNSNSSSCNGD